MASGSRRAISSMATQRPRKASRATVSTASSVSTATVCRYANKKIEELDTRRQTISKAIAELSVETMSPQKEQELSYFLDHWDSIDFDDKRKAADGLIISISATSDHVQVEWKI